MVIINGFIHPVAGPDIPDGFVAWEGNRITAVGSMKEFSRDPDEEILDARGGHVTPGYIDAHCHLGLFGSAMNGGGEDVNECTDPITPQLRALDAIDPMDYSFVEAQAAGVTTVVTGPGSTNPIAGQMVCVKTRGTVADQMVVRAPLAMKLALGENPKRAYGHRRESPATRMATAALIREALERARRYADKKDKGQDPDFDPKLEALVPVVRGELPVHIHAHRADDIATALRITKEFNLKSVLVHASDGHLMPKEIAESGFPVITGPILTDRSKSELKYANVYNPEELDRAGAKVAICTDHPEVPIQYLTLCAALAMRGGMTEWQALAAITLFPAEILGIDDRLGSLTVGKEADIVITPGRPLDVTVQPSAVILGGEQVMGREQVME